MSDEDSESGSTTTDPDTPVSCFWWNKKSCRRLWCSYNTYWQLFSAGVGISIYILVGGLIFSAIERPNELRKIEESQAARNDALANFTSLLLSSTNLTEEEVLNMTETFLALGETFIEASNFAIFAENPLWDVTSAIFFCTISITTIGYGNIAPTTRAGQNFFIFYAFIGIPMALLFLGVIGSIIKTWVNRALRPFEQKHGKVASRAMGSFLLLLVILIFFMVLPAVIFISLEFWTFEQSLYFTVVTLTTVGFGDFIPARSLTAVSQQLLGLYAIMSTFWLWIGLALVAALLSEIQSFFKFVNIQCHTRPCFRIASKVKEKKTQLQKKKEEVEEMGTLRSSKATSTSDDMTGYYVTPFHE